MKSWCPAALVLVLGAAACERDAYDGAALAEITFEDERRIDLTGDGRAESVRVEAHGSSWDSLHVRLQIHDGADSLLYHDAWSSLHYFRYYTDGMPPDTAVQRIVRGHLTELLRDTAFAPPAVLAGERNPAGVLPDADAIRYDIAEHSWRRSAGVPDTVPLPPGAYDQIEALLVPESAVADLANALARQPSFTYYAGGEVVYSVAWSHEERRFLRIRSCC